MTQTEPEKGTAPVDEQTRDKSNPADRTLAGGSRAISGASAGAAIGIAIGGPLGGLIGASLGAGVSAFLSTQTGKEFVRNFKSEMDKLQAVEPEKPEDQSKQQKNRGGTEE